jgi:tetratricopeptide (TPR) repeat protein
MAYSLLATCYRSLPGPAHEDKVEQALSRAFELSHHASPRERFQIQARYYRYRGRGSWGKYLETCQEFVRVYPDDTRAVLELGAVYLALEEWERSIETLESIIDVNVFSAHFDLLQRAYGAQGKYEEALAVAEAAPAETYPFQYPYQLALNLVRDRRFEPALLEADKMLERDPGHSSALFLKGDIHFFRAEWDQAEAYYRELLNPVGPDFHRLRFRLYGLLRLAYLHLAKGQFQKSLGFPNQAIDELTALGESKWLSVFHTTRALILLAQGDLSRASEEIRTALEQSEQRDHVTAKIFVLHVQGMILLKMGDVRGAERAADEIRAEIDGWLNPKLMRLWYRLAGHIELVRNNLGQAVGHFEQAVALLPHQHNPNGDNHAEYYSSLAYAYYLSGDLAKAQEWYENVLSLTFGRLSSGDFYAKSHFMLGKIYEQRGMNAEAIRSYRTFLDLWRDADSAAPDLEEAQQSLAALLD